MSNSYKNQEIVELSEREQCRLKLPIFFGDRSNFEHSLREVLANSRDEILNNFEDGTIYIKLYDDCETIEILDTGRGINLQGETNGVKNYYLLLEKLWAGGNHNNLELGIASTGTNSVGLTCTNYCAELFEATSYKNNHYFKVSYKNGGELIGVDEGVDKNISHGTRIKFKQDKDVYTSTTFSSDTISSLCNKLASTTNRVTYIYEHKGETKTFSYSSQTEYVQNNCSNFITSPHQFTSKQYESDVNVDGKSFIEKDTVSLNLSVSTEPLIETYLNGTYLVEGGSIEDGIIDGIKKYFQKFVSNKVKLSNQDIEMSFNIHCVFTSTNPSFSGQTKFSSASPLYKKICTSYVIDNLEIYKAENDKEFNKILSHLQQINSFNTKNENSIKNIKKKLSEKSDTFTNRVETLVDCRVHGEDAEIYITEGKSALSSVVASRDANFQAAIPVRGKTLSVLKASADQIFNNQIIIDIIKTLGCGCSFKNGKKKLLDDFNIDNLRYGKVIITVDRDSDGSSIACLLATTFYKLMPELLRQGKVYLAKTPLYEITTKQGELIYAFSDKERDDIVKANQVAKIQRNKGLGEMTAEVMAETTMNPKTRVIEKIVINDEKDMTYYFEKWMGADVSLRREHIEENLYKYMSDLD